MGTHRINAAADLYEYRVSVYKYVCACMCACVCVLAHVCVCSVEWGSNWCCLQGQSWSMGMDPGAVTLPNILKHYNPLIMGGSRGFHMYEVRRVQHTHTHMHTHTHIDFLKNVLV